MDKVAHLSRFKKVCDKISILTGAHRLTDEEVLTYFQQLEKYNINNIENVMLDLVLHDTYGRRFPAIGEIVAALAEVKSQEQLRAKPTYCRYCQGSGVLEANNYTYSCVCSNAKRRLKTIPDDLLHELFPKTYAEMTINDLERMQGQEMFLPIKVLGMTCELCDQSYDVELTTKRVDIALEVVSSNCRHLCEQCYIEEGRRYGFWE